jgi:hypothetical protein
MQKLVFSKFHGAGWVVHATSRPRRSSDADNRAQRDPTPRNTLLPPAEPRAFPVLGELKSERQVRRCIGTWIPSSRERACGPKTRRRRAIAPRRAGLGWVRWSFRHHPLSSRAHASTVPPRYRDRCRFCRPLHLTSADRQACHGPRFRSRPR